MGHGLRHARPVRVICFGAILFVLGALGCMGITSVSASSFTITVTTTADTSDACATSGVAPCSLRDAARYASAEMTTAPVVIFLPAGDYQQAGWTDCNNAPPIGAGPFTFAPSGAGTLNPVYLIGAGASGTIIHGAGVGNTHFPVFDNSGASVTMTGITITNGSADNCSPASGGAIRSNGGNLTLANSIITGNTARSGGGLAIAGGATILNTQITNNRACTGGGIEISGGSASLIANTTITGNHQGAAAGDPTGFCYGIAGGDAGGIGIGYGVLQIKGSTIANNSSVYNFPSPGSPGGMGVGDATLTLTDSTIANNSSVDGVGGMSGRGTIALTNSTVAGNTGVAGGVQAINRAVTGTLTLTGTIVQGSGPLCSGVTSGGYNIAGDATCALSQSTDHPSTDAQLGSFGNHGGPTSTYALNPGSPALNAIPAASCPTSVDKRGVVRPQGSGCDIGAVEAGATPPALNAIGPLSGGTGGGSSVTLIGTGFTAGSEVQFDTTGVPTTYVNGATMRATAPPHALGLADITVTVPGIGSATVPRIFFYGEVNVLPVPTEPSGSAAAGSSPAPLPATQPAEPNPGQAPGVLPSRRTSSAGASQSGPTAQPDQSTVAPLPLPSRR